MGAVLPIITTAYGLLDSANKNQLATDENARFAGETDKLRGKAATQRKKANNDYKLAIQDIQNSYNKGIAEVDEFGQPTDLKKEMDRVRNNFQTVSNLAIKQWASSRGIGGSSMEGTKVGEAANMASQKADDRRMEVVNQLFQQAQSKAGDAGNIYKTNMGEINAGLTDEESQINLTHKQNTERNAGGLGVQDLSNALDVVGGLFQGGASGPMPNLPDLNLPSVDLGGSFDSGFGNRGFSLPGSNYNTDKFKLPTFTGFEK